LGTEAAAAHQIALTLASFSFSIALGIGASTSVRVGHAVGRGDTPGARRSGLAGGLLGAGLMGLFAIVFVLMPGGLARLFSNQTAVVAAAIPLLQIAALFQLSDATQAVMAGALRGAGDTRATLIGNLAGHYLIGLPLMLILAFGMSMGAPGLWWALSAGLTAVGVALAIRFAVLTRSPIARS
ncbi:MAG: MATE family efflux transporter, partial [Deltaproteobacteria bacterium]|nr:MATE family efflux transporter [Deltaproteobacteria bacterium]